MRGTGQVRSAAPTAVDKCINTLATSSLGWGNFKVGQFYTISQKATVGLSPTQLAAITTTLLP